MNDQTETTAVEVAAWEEKTSKKGGIYLVATLKTGEKVFVFNQNIQALLREGTNQIPGVVDKNEAGYMELRPLGFAAEKANPRAYRSKSDQIRELSDRKHNAYTQAGLSANLGGLFHDAVSVLSQLPDFKMAPEDQKVEKIISFVEKLFAAKTALEERIHGDEKPL